MRSTGEKCISLSETLNGRDHLLDLGVHRIILDGCEGKSLTGADWIEPAKRNHFFNAERKMRKLGIVKKKFCYLVTYIYTEFMCYFRRCVKYRIFFAWNR
jgi:hypothetical protein